MNIRENLTSMSKESVNIPSFTSTSNNQEAKLKSVPIWYDGKTINEIIFCEEFLKRYRLIYTEGAFFSTEGKISDESKIKTWILDEIKEYVTSSITKKIHNITELLKLSACVESFSPQTDRIHFQNGTLFLNDNVFSKDKHEIVRARFPIDYNPNASEPFVWLNTLDSLFYPEDIPAIQEFIGYCLIPTNKGQRMLFIKGKGGEGKSQIGIVIRHIFGSNAKDGSVAKLSEDRFARADLEHENLMIDDDMKVEALKQTDYIKKIVTSNGKMDLEKKGKQSYQGYMYVRIIAFSNGDLQALYDKSDGFYRRQLVVVTKEKSHDRKDNPFIAEQMCAESEGILCWAIEGLKRLIANNYVFSESERMITNRETVRSNSCNAIEFLSSEGFIEFDEESTISSKELYEVYCYWCNENAYAAMKVRSFSDFMSEQLNSLPITKTNNIRNDIGGRVWGYKGIKRVAYKPTGNSLCTYVPNDVPF